MVGNASIEIFGDGDNPNVDDCICGISSLPDVSVFFVLSDDES
jgi:hypothetical protein